MKKYIIYFAAFMLTVSMGACRQKTSDAAGDSVQQTDSSKANDLPYEYTEEVPVPAPGQPDPSTVEAESGKTPYIVDFSAKWCGPCRQLKPYFNQMEETYKGEADFATVDIDQNPELAKKHGVDAVPTVIIFSDKSMTQELYRITGFAPQELEQAIMDNI
ncbi:MAG: thioredoxin family protein [Prevotella sp.]|nr:thioredoxin family protein [Prevotella sp.]MCM1074658.1 thioredoxin family protein [Ruminococcus sp.]